ncbi:hypothetical protein PG993_004082 [Apiospora rasikravindrae]|uniref:Uncharacterized protein n=1 Tax=Apiospora rasikravindrae TaxID=990691 RepID=A0ABR1TEE9_9PEZI
MSLRPEAIIAIVGIFVAVPSAFTILWKLGQYMRAQAQATDQHPRTPPSSTVSDPVVVDHSMPTEETASVQDSVRAMEEGIGQSTANQKS